MNYASPEKLAQLADSKQRLKRLLRNRIEVLKEKLDNFTVVDINGKPVGEVRNLLLNQRQLSLLIVRPDIHRYWHFVLLSSRLVQQISLRDRVVLVQTTQADMSYLPEHQATQHSAHLSDETSAQTDFKAPVHQLPASLLTDRRHRLKPANGTMTFLGQAIAQSATPTPGNAKPLWDVPERPKVLADAVDAMPRSAHSQTSDPQTQTSTSKN
ncbi:MAG: hypothetical protein KME42_01455 [Tildeniella nuda ZEHNDER 1965/U140]|jgi:sporulation protein YlmC with PRC-barrel domain|nr:hypothetical protein [Tildeniella nuda ZEHNDER 1965/U140]